MKVRCSQLGRLMGGFKAPKADLTEDAKTLIEEIYVKEVYKREKIIDSKEMQKGREQEEKGITVLSNVQKKLYIKNKTNLENDYITGTLDIKTDEVVTDIKLPFTIWNFIGAELKNEYAWQLTGYMWLTGLKKAQLAYVLVDTPYGIVFDETKRACFMTGIFAEGDPEGYQKLEEQMQKNHSFSDIPEEKRVKTFLLDFDEKKVELIKSKMELARQYYKQLELSI